MDANFNVVAFRRARTSNPPLGTEAKAGEVRPIRGGVCSAIASPRCKGELQWMRLTGLSAIASFFKEKLWVNWPKRAFLFSFPKEKRRVPQ